MRQTFAEALTILDRGVQLYRQQFLPLVLIAVIFGAPIVVLAALLPLVDTNDTTQLVLVALFDLVVGLTLLAYLLLGVCRTAMAAIGGERIGLRRAVWVSPLRVFKIGLVGAMVAFVLQVATASAGLLFGCVTLALLIGAGGIMAFSSGASGSSGVLLLLAVLYMLMVALFGLSAVVVGAGYAAALSTVQPLIFKTLKIRQLLVESFELFFYRFGLNLLVWLGAMLALLCVSVPIGILFGAIGPLPAAVWLNLDTKVGQVFSLMVLGLGGVVLLPPLPIWMALLYHHQSESRGGGDLAERVATWAAPADVGGR